ncbi:unnamed protein product [Alternaria burnsii]|nr:unnamed protein product [Alternaria burnsii]
MSRPQKSPMHWPTFPDIPIYLDTGDERATAKTYGTTPTTPTTPDISAQGRPMHLSPAHINAQPVSPVEPSPTTTIETSSHRSIIWPIPEPPPEIQHQQDSRRPTLRFFPTQRPRVRLDSIPSLQIPQINDKIQEINEKTPISSLHPGLGIINGPPKPPSIEISAPIEEGVEGSGNIAQRIEQTLWRYTRSGNILKRWLLEILSWSFSAACMATIIGVLIYLKDEPLSKWPLAEKTGLTLNALISVLSKMAGAALILPVAEALGQLKWSWFLDHSKQMWDWEIFDNASRGPWGAALLLIRTKCRSLAAVGAFITLLSLALDPFFQQVVDFPDRWALQHTTSSIPRTESYTPFYKPEFFQGFEANVADPAFRPVISQFFVDNGTQPVEFGNGTRPEIPLSCPTSNCTWPEYETLGVCSQCVEASNLLEWACLYTKIDWSANSTGPISDDTMPNGTVCGYYLNATSEAPVLMSGYIMEGTEEQPVEGEALLVRSLPLTEFLTKIPLYGEGSVNFKHIRNPILDALIVSAPDGVNSVFRNETPIAHECVLAWCVQTIKSSYDWGRYTENITSVNLNTTTGKFPWESFEVQLDTEVAQMILYTQDIAITPPASSRNGPDTLVANKTYGMSNTTAFNVMLVFDDYVPSYYTAMTPTESPMLRYKNYLDGPSTRELPFNPFLAPNNLTRHMERLASAMTNVIRSSAESRLMLSGKAYSKENYVDVRWVWLTLPIGLLFTALIFLAATVLQSAIEVDRVGVYKTSAIATLLYGLSDDIQQKITSSTDQGTPRAKAKELRVKLQPNHGWRVSGNLFSPFPSKPKPNLPPPGWI